MQTKTKTNNYVTQIIEAIRMHKLIECVATEVDRSRCVMAIFWWCTHLYIHNRKRN